MTTKFLALISVIGLTSICLLQAQLLVPGGSPAASPSPTKHRAHKKAEATASPAEEAASPSSAESPAASPSPTKQRARKKVEATASPAEEAALPSSAESPAASPSPAKHPKKAKAATAASPVAAESTAAASASPAEKRSQKKAKTAVAASPAPSASPGKFTLGNLFKPRTSASAAPAAASPAPAKSAATEAATNPPAQGGGHGLVWVNTESHVYHREGSRFYGTTKKGKYVTEQEAINEGDKAAGKGR